MTEVPTDAAALADALARFPSFRVLVVGDVMLDSVVRGEVRRVSPEAPAPVLLAGEERHDLGGAANVAHQLAALGATVELFGVVGADPEAAQIRDRCDSLGITATLLQDATVPTTRKIRYLAGPHHLLRVDREAVVRDTSMLEVALRDRFANGPRPDVVVLSDYGKGVVDPAVSTLVTGSASRCGVPVLLDPKTDDLVRCRGASVIKANGAEFEALTGRAIDHADVARGVEA